MTTKKALGALLGLMTVAVLCGRSEAAVTNPARLTIEVTVNAQLSVKVDGVEGSTRAATITPGTPYVNEASTATVLSDATGIAEYWKLNAHNAVKKADYSLGWTLVTSTSGVSNSGSVVKVTNCAVPCAGNASCSICICLVMRGQGPAQRVKMMSATHTFPRNPASVICWPAWFVTIIHPPFRPRAPA